MAQPILKRRLNPLLLISTIAALSLLAGVSVIAQDQIANAQQNVSETTEELNEAESKVQELSVENENMSRSMYSLNKTLNGVSSELEEKKEEVENKTERIQELESQLEQQEEASLNQNNGDQVREMNTSLQVLCEWGEPADESNRQSMESQCQEWGHELGG